MNMKFVEPHDDQPAGQIGDASGAGDRTPRQHWMSVLAKAASADLARAWDGVPGKPEYRCLRPPETGLVMVQARMGGAGGRFNFGEMTMTRCIVETADGTTGHAYVAGSDVVHAEIAAALDAMLQMPARRTEILETVVAPLDEDYRTRQRAVETKTAATRVNFFTLVRGEDE